ncbi:MAG: MFS transporter, partial [Solirubrobacteraceae bacterium]
VAAGAALLAAAAAPAVAVLIVISALIGIATPIPQLIVPLALGLADEADQGRIIGRIQSGLLIGVLGSRLYAGALASAVDWRAVYVVSAILTLGVAALVLRAIPEQAPRATASYGDLLRSMRDQVRTSPVVRQICLSGGLVGIAFGSFWTVLVFMLQSAYGYGPAVIGSFGLVAAASAMFSPRAGRLADRRGGAFALRLTIVMSIAGWLLLAGGEHSLVWVLLGVVVLDLGVWGNQVVNQFVLLRSAPAERSRLNTLYFTARFGGIGAGSAFGSALWSASGWDAVVMLGVGSCLAGWLVAVRVVDPAAEAGDPADGPTVAAVPTGS